MSTPAVDELTRFIANPAPEPIVRQFGVLYCEVLNLVRLAMIPGGWLPDPTAFQPDPGTRIPRGGLEPKISRRNARVWRTILGTILRNQPLRRPKPGLGWHPVV